MQFPEFIKPEIIAIGPVSIRWYSLMYIIGFIFAYILFNRFAKQNELKLKQKFVDSLIFYIFWGLLLGARIGYVVVYGTGEYLSNPLNIIAVWHGGLSFHGGLFGILLAILIFSRRYSIPFYNVTDCTVLIAPIGLGLGRIGNFINQELYGRVTDVPWGIVFATSPDKQPRHPSQLYESFFEGVVLFTILWMFKNKFLGKKHGYLSSLFVICYGVFRGGIEFFREPDVQMGYYLGFLTMGQLLCLLMIVCGIGMFWHARKLNTLIVPVPKGKNK